MSKLISIMPCTIHTPYNLKERKKDLYALFAPSSSEVKFYNHQFHKNDVDQTEALNKPLLLLNWLWLSKNV